MYTKKILSAAAAVAVLSSGLSAFDIHENKIATDREVSKITYASYTEGKPASEKIKLSNRLGDALIYPAFNQKGNWSTDIVVRNTSAHAIVAKVVFYNGKNSEELIDFNIYLSPYDAYRLKIKDNEITSTDGSHKVKGVDPIQAKDTADGDYHGIKFANEEMYKKDISSFGNKFESGYIAIFGMVQVKKENQFHEDHASIYAGYTRLLDKKRGDDTQSSAWRHLNNSAIRRGSIFIEDSRNIDDSKKLKAVRIAPNVTLDPAGETVTWNKASNKTETATFEDVADVLSGEVRLNDGEGHDMLLQAQAISGFSADNHVLLWTAGEYASIADRCIDNTGLTYDIQCLTDDSKEFLVNQAIYTYSNATQSENEKTYNQVLITQPYKRTMLQLKELDGYKIDKSNTKANEVVSGDDYYFQIEAEVYDEDEKSITTSTEIKIVDAAESGVAGDTAPSNETRYSSELEVLKSDIFDKSDDNNATFHNKNGFATFSVGVPAIITQMVASSSGSSLETNWIYSTISK